MKTSQQGLNLLIDRESLELKAYRDSEGYWSIGVGHLLSLDKDADFSSLVWTREHAIEVFARDIERFEKAINDNVHVDLEQYQFDALVSWLFNVGEAWARKPAHLIKLVNAGNFAAAAIEFNNWRIPASITTRRNGEREQFKGTAFEARLAA